MNKSSTIITKASGEKVAFSPEKLMKSLQRSGAGDEVIENILLQVKSQLYEGMPTKKIYKLAFSLLKKVSKPSAARYSLKKAIMELGPSGFPFEKFVSEILKHRGYKVRVGEIVLGHCVKHEVDVIAEINNHHIMIECKYHNLPGISCDVKIPLYIHSRFRDVEVTWKKLPGHENKIHQGWVVTNTKFTDDAIQYGQCAGLQLIGWNYPFNENLKTMIDKSGLYPLTCLTTITRTEKQHLLDNKVVLCREINTQRELLKLAHVAEARYENILLEIRNLCQGMKDQPKNS